MQVVLDVYDRQTNDKIDTFKLFKPLNYFGSGPNIHEPEYDFYKIEKKYKLSKYHFVVIIKEKEMEMKFLVNYGKLEKANEKSPKACDIFEVQKIALGDNIRAGLLKFVLSKDSFVQCSVEPKHSIMLKEEIRMKRKKYQSFICSFCVEERKKSVKEKVYITHEKYDIFEHITGSNNHDVYKAVEKETMKQVIIKTFNQSDHDINSQTKNELRKTNDLRHSYILNYNEIISLSQSEYGLVYDFIIGGDLQSHIDKKGWVKANIACQIIIQLLDAINFAHEKKIIHHDIKPSNILLIDNISNFDNKAESYIIPETIKLCDFGIADVLAEQAGDHLTSDFKGTLPYAAPEQLIPHIKQPSIDLYAVGITFYYMICKDFPYDDVYDKEKLKKEILSEDRIPIEERISKEQKLPTKLTEIINKSISRKVEDRYNDALEFREIIESFFNNYYQNTGTKGG